MTTLLLVHGRSQQHKDPATLKAEWLADLERGLAAGGLTLPIDADAVRFPYYGDTLDQLTHGRTDPAGVVTRGADGGADDAESAFLGAVAEEMRESTGISDARVETARDDASVEAHDPENWPWVLAILRTLDDHFSFTSGPSIATFTRDVYVYLNSIGVRDVIDAGVRDAVVPGEPMVVVGHSLGSVVAYNVLRHEAAARDWTIPLFVTVGCPLGISAIRRKLSPTTWPAGVSAWFNARDPQDVVALHPLDAEHFGTLDHPVQDYAQVDNTTSNQHGIAGYLGDPEVARRIHDALVS